MKVLATCFAALLLAVVLPAHAESTPAQRNQLENCKILSGAVFEFAEARDKKQSKMDTFKEVTHGQSYVPGSLLDETLQWAYAHPQEQPDTASAHFYGRCVLDAYDARNPDTEGELDIAAQGCQQGHAGAPAAIRDCIEDKAQDIVTRTQTAVASAVSPAPAAVTAATSLPTPTSSTVLAVAQVAPPPTQPAGVPAVPATQAEVPAPAPVVLPQLMATPASPAASPVAEVAPPAAPPVPHEVITAAPAISVAEPVVASTQAPRPPLSAPEAPAAPPVQAPPLPPATAAPLSVSIPPRPASITPPAPAIAASSAPASVQAGAPQAVASLPPLPSAKASAAGPPPNLPGFDKLTLGMSMDDAYKAMGSHGDRDWDSQGEVHTYLIGDGHGFIELRPSSTGTLYSIRVVGGADAHLAPILNVVLGDGAFVLLNNVGEPSSRTPLPGDKQLWNYLGRNYAFEISPGGDVIGVRITDTGGADAAQ